ncbi:hypothetical protein CPHLJ_7g780 [Cryptosporidium parvum]|nr:Uncharacterized protein CPATCC_0006530 [Cryptosporidium parvum]WKS78759.1 hypothetical protein CPCDC_7g780 [Cryptosporidium sp. 43IA8]WRK33245.1 Uncharacterized protein cpbgf_700780 [Cryptosporidium parvum]|eukprot:QOY40392.1 hypothetical protein CPATCC_003234 [Cryptosporidium parvum]
MSSLLNGLSSEITLSGGGGMIKQELNFGNDRIIHSAQNENTYKTVKTAEISPLRSGLMINEESEEKFGVGAMNNRGSASLGLNSGFSENYYSGFPTQQPQVYFQTKNIPMFSEAMSSGQHISIGGYNMLSSHSVGPVFQQSENTNYMTNTSSGMQIKRLNIPSNSVKSVSTIPSNGVSDIPIIGGTSGYEYKDGSVLNGVCQQPFQTQNLAKNITGNSSNLHITGNKSTKIQENLNLNTNSSSITIHPNNTNNSNVYPSEKPLPSARAKDDYLQYEQYSSVNTKSFISQQNTALQTNFQSNNLSNVPFFSTNTSNPNQMNSLMNPHYLNSVPLLAQIRIECIQDLPNNFHHHSMGIYSSITNMDYSIVASFNNIDDKNETYRIGPFPSSSMSNSKLNCIVQDEISIPFSWSQPILKLKILEENDFKADIIGVCSISIDMSSIGIPSQACLIDPQTNQVRGTLRFVVKLVPNQQNPNYRFDQIHGPNSILNRRYSHDDSIFNIFKGFCCAD